MTLRRACVIGWPVKHSRSPLIHGYWLRRYGIEGDYTREAVEPADLPAFLAGLEGRGFAGCNVTLPHKEAAFGLVDVADSATTRLGVVNTVFRRDGRLMGTSTDGEGFLANLRQAIPAWHGGAKVVTLLGAGGSARAVAGALVDGGVSELRVVNRSLDRAGLLRKDFGSSVIPMAWSDIAAALADCDLLINTTSLGMTGQPPLEIDLQPLPHSAVVADIVYAPLETQLLKEARARGLWVVPGLGMLLHQAVRGFELWFGVRPEVTPELYELIADDIRRGG